jgi:hypothetical protein
VYYHGKPGVHFHSRLTPQITHQTRTSIQAARTLHIETRMAWRRVALVVVVVVALLLRTSTASTYRSPENWYQEFCRGGTVDARALGAHGDGVTVDTRALQACRHGVYGLRVKATYRIGVLVGLNRNDSTTYLPYYSRSTRYAKRSAERHRGFSSLR